MKLKNIAAGIYIQSKKDNKQLIAGHCYQVAEKDVSDKTIRLFSVDGSFDDSLWFCVSDFRKPRPQFKQLDQSVFDGAYKIWRFASVDADGAGFRFAERPELTDCFWRNVNCSRFDRLSQSGTYDASNWQNSLIERDTAKELLEVDLSSELTGSELCRAMLARGDKYILCLVGDGGDYRVANQGYAFIVTGVHSNGEFDTPVYTWEFAVPINNQGEPLTQAEAGL